MHRDLKLDNILINKIDETGEVKVKIADFGLAVFTSSNPRVKLFEKCGTPCYAAPEILSGNGYSSKCDIFSLGSIFFNMLTGRYLFPGTRTSEVLKKNMDCDLDWLKYFFEDVTPDCKNLILQMLEKDPSKRPSAK